MHRWYGAVIAVAVLGIAAPPAVAAPGSAHGTDRAGDPVTITFGGPAPCLFNKTQPLRDEYASLGVHFDGPTSTEGGAILRRCASFGVRPRSGHKFLAFNSNLYAKVPETLTFDDLVSRVDCYVANGDGGEAHFTLTGWRNGTMVASEEIVTETGSYFPLGVHAAQGIDTVVLDASTLDDNTFVVDDLSFVPLG